MISFHLLWQMSMDSYVYIGFTDGASRYTQNSALVVWVIYTPIGQVLSLGGVCLWPLSNNVAEYTTIIELLCDSISHGLHSLQVLLDLQLVVSQINGSYCIQDPTLL